MSFLHRFMLLDPYIRWAHAFQVIACLLVAWLVSMLLSALVDYIINRRAESHGDDSPAPAATTHPHFTRHRPKP